jgi:hypothetical protein
MRVLKTILMTTLFLASAFTLSALDQGKMQFCRDKRSFAGYLWQNELTGTMNLHNLVLDFKSEARFTNNTQGGANFEFPLIGTRERLFIGFNYFEHSGTLLKAVNYDKLTYAPTASMKVATRFGELGGAHALSSDKDSYFDLLYGAKWIRHEIELSGTNIAKNLKQQSSWDKKMLSPFLGIGAQTNGKERVFGFGHLKFFPGSIKTIDLDANVAFRLSAHEDTVNEWYVTLGYRKFVSDSDRDDDVLKTDYQGPTFGLFGRF